jgi:uncharacterized protein YjiS (DUF1127 family)
MTSFTPATATSYVSSSDVRKVNLAGYAAQLLRWYDRARQRRQLKNMDARLLDDIGVTRSQAVEEARKPGWSA